jgi:hypothetical protein
LRRLGNELKPNSDGSRTRVRSIAAVTPPKPAPTMTTLRPWSVAAVAEGPMVVLLTGGEWRPVNLAGAVQNGKPLAEKLA